VKAAADLLMAGKMKIKDKLVIIGQPGEVNSNLPLLTARLSQAYRLGLDRRVKF